MEHQFKYFQLLLLISFAFLGSSCGYFETDKIESQSPITGSIFLQKQENTSTNNLVFEEAKGVYAVILEECTNLYYDSANKKVYAENHKNSKEKNYWRIDIYNPFAKYVSEAVKVVKIEKIFFDEKIKGLESSMKMQ